MTGRVARRFIQFVALAVIWFGGATTLEAAACGDFGQCMPSCTNPQGFCDNGPPACSHEGFCSGLPCEVPGEEHIYCMFSPE